MDEPLNIKNAIKPIFYVISAITFLDIFFNPNKHFVFLKLDKQVLALIALVTAVCLVTLIANYFFRISFNIKQGAKVTYFITALIIINEVLFSYSFYHLLQFLIAGLLGCPIPLIISEWKKPLKRKLFMQMFVGSLVILLSTFIYFNLIYVPYEDYLLGFPIMFVHYWIRNWLIFISLCIMITALLSKNNR